MRHEINYGKLPFSPTNENGFTLLEVLIAIVILSLGLLGLSAMTISTLRGLAFSEDMTTATNLAQEKMEEIKNKGYNEVLQASYPMEDYDTIAGFNQFQRQVEIIPDTPLPVNTKTVIISVSWKRFKGGQPHQVKLQTIISR